MLTAETRIVPDTWAQFCIDRLSQDNYVGKHRGAAAGPWMAYEARHRSPGGEMASVGYRLVPLGEVSE